MYTNTWKKREDGAFLTNTTRRHALTYTTLTHDMYHKTTKT